MRYIKVEIFGRSLDDVIHDVTMLYDIVKESLHLSIKCVLYDKPDMTSLYINISNRCSVYFSG